MNINNKLMVLFSIFIIVSVSYFPAYAKNESKKIIIESHIYGLNGKRDINIGVNEDKAEEIFIKLKRLNNALINNDGIQALKISYELKNEGIFDNEIMNLLLSRFGKPLIQPLQMNLTNLMCFVTGFGEEGIFIYSMDLILIISFILFFSLIPLGFLLAFALAFIELFLSHLIPIRVVNPLIYFGVKGGEMTTMGLMGTRILGENSNDTVSGLMIGFIGIIINIIYPLSSDKSWPYFCMGYSLSVLANH